MTTASVPMAEIDRTPEKSLGDTVLNLILKDAPCLNPELEEFEGVQVITFEDAYWGEFMQWTEKYLNEETGDKGRNRRKRERINKLDHSGLLEVKDCFEIVTIPSNQRLYILPKEQLAALKKKGTQKRTAKIDDSLEKWFEQHAEESDESQEDAEKLILGEYSYILPILAGLKPVGFSTNQPTPYASHKIEFLQSLARKCGNFDFIAVGNSSDHQDFIFYNPEAITRVVTKNKKNFEQCEISPSMDPKEILKKMFDRPTSLSSSEYGTIIDQASGLLLGFDKTSVMNFPNNSAQSNSPFNIWGLSYQIYEEDSNTDFKQSKKDYDALLQETEKLLAEGLSPMEVLTQLKNWYSIHIKQVHVAEKIQETMA